MKFLPIHPATGNGKGGGKMKIGKDPGRAHARVASAVPGRLRIKLHPSKRNPALMKGVKQSLVSREGVHDVRVNDATGSITIHYDQARHSKENVLKLLEDVDTVFHCLGHEADFGSLEGGVDDAIGSAGFLESLNDLNRRIYVMTGIPLDLKTIMPLAFAGAGLWSISKRGLMIEAVPGWLFLWLAFDMFVKMHPSERATS
jgi:hypothetical protein